MSETLKVSVRNQAGARTPSHPQLNVVVGNAVTFQAVEVASTLHFSPDLIEILTPKPTASVSLSPGHDLTYTFAADDPGTYEIFFLAPGLAAPQSFDGPAADHTSFLVLLKCGPVLEASIPSPLHPPIAMVGGLTSNPIQTLHAAAQTRSFLGSVETEEHNITSNPIQT